MSHRTLHLLLPALLALVFPARVPAGDGLAMLKNDHGARAAGMAAAYVSIGGNPDAAVYNPASAGTVNRFTASFGHTFFWENIRIESAYIASNLFSRVHVHGGVRFAAVDELEARLNPTSEPIAEFDAHDVSLKAGLAYRFTDRIYAGLGMGWFIEKIEAWRGSAFNVDLGILTFPTENVNVGASVTNFGSDFCLEKRGVPGSRDISLPLAYRVGGSYRYQSYLGAADVVIVDDEFHLHLGAEAQLHELFLVRAGYMFNYDTKNFTAGASFTRRDLTVDYAFVPYTGNLGTSHMFNFTFSL